MFGGVDPPVQPPVVPPAPPSHKYYDNEYYKKEYEDEDEDEYEKEDEDEYEDEDEDAYEDEDEYDAYSYGEQGDLFNVQVKPRTACNTVCTVAHALQCPTGCRHR